MTKQQSDELLALQAEQTHDWESRYKESDDLPWDSGMPAPELVEYFDGLGAGKHPQAVLEVGCGTGTNAVWLAQKGAKVTATEIAPTALDLAKSRAQKAGVEIAYKLIDICQTAPVAESSQDFAFDRGVFHVIPAGLRAKFVASLAAGLKSGAHWLSLAGSKDEHRADPNVGPPQLSAVELLEHIEPLFEVVKLERTYFVLPDGSKHLAWKALYKRR